MKKDPVVVSLIKKVLKLISENGKIVIYENRKKVKHNFKTHRHIF